MAALRTQYPDPRGWRAHGGSRRTLSRCEQAPPSAKANRTRVRRDHQLSNHWRPTAVTPETPNHAWLTRRVKLLLQLRNSQVRQIRLRCTGPKRKPRGPRLQTSRHEGNDQRSGDRWRKGNPLAPAMLLHLCPSELNDNKVNDYGNGKKNCKHEGAFNADPQESDRKHFNVATAHHALRIIIEHDDEHEECEADIPMNADPSS